MVCTILDRNIQFFMQRGLCFRFPLCITHIANVKELHIYRIIFQIDHIAIRATRIAFASITWALNRIHMGKRRILFRKFIHENFVAL